MSEWPKTAHYFKDRESFRDHISGCVESVLASSAVVHGIADYVVLKDPNFATMPNEIKELFPTSTFLFCVRDPRDIVCSFLDIERREASLKLQRKNYIGRNIVFYCNKIRNSFRYSMHPAFQGIVTRYEDVVTDPQEELKRIAAKSGLPLVLPDLQTMQWTEAKSRHKESWTTSLEGKMPSTGSVAKYKKYLSHLESHYIENRCRGILEKYDYHKSLRQSGFPFSLRIYEIFCLMRNFGAFVFSKIFR